MSCGLGVVSLKPPRLKTHDSVNTYACNAR